MSRMVLLSDPHLSPTHGFFWDNWRRMLEAANAEHADCVLVNGDLCINGPDSIEELIFARAALDRLEGGRILALPGNHDVGDEPPGQDPEQLINAPRLHAWREIVGPDCFAVECGHWWLIGINAQLCGSGLPEEAEQDAWLDSVLAQSAERSIALFLHKPLFLDNPAEDVPTIASLNLAARRELMARLATWHVKLVVSGHLHQSRDVTLDGVRYLWLPAIAFQGSPTHGGDPTLGGCVLDFAREDEVGVRFLRPEGLVAHDLNALKGQGQYAFLRDMPACPPEID